MNVIFILVTTCIWALGLLQTGGLLEHLLAPLSYALTYGLWLKVLCFALCLFDATLESNPMDEKMFNDFLIGK